MWKGFKIFLAILFIAIVLLIVILNYANAGDVNPQDLVSNWKIIQIAPYPEKAGLFQALLMNPDTEHPVKLVYVVYLPKAVKGVIEAIVILAYYYEKDGVKYAFVYNSYLKKFIQKSPIEV